MAKRRIDPLDRITYWIVRAVASMLLCWPVDVNLALARFLGSCLYTIDPWHRRRAIDNIRHAFPAWSDAQVKKLTRRSMQSLVMLAMDLLFTTRLVHLDTWSRYVELENFQEALGLLLKRKGGVIFITGHYGSWEILGYLVATLGFEMNVVGRPLDNPYLNDWLLGVRQKRGQKMIDKKGATQEVTAVLDGGGIVALIADQNAGRKGIFVDFFGRKASTYKSIGLLAMQYEVPVVVGYARRQNGRFKFRAGVEEIIYPKDWRDQPDPLGYLTQRYTTAIEKLVRVEPEQYLWVHRRWKSRPPGEATSDGE